MYLGFLKNSVSLEIFRYLYRKCRKKISDHKKNLRYLRSQSEQFMDNTHDKKTPLPVYYVWNSLWIHLFLSCMNFGILFVV